MRCDVMNHFAVDVEIQTVPKPQITMPSAPDKIFVWKIPIKQVR
jgi:hypothetical protein